MWYMCHHKDKQLPQTVSKELKISPLDWAGQWLTHITRHWSTSKPTDKFSNYAGRYFQTPHNVCHIVTKFALGSKFNLPNSFVFVV